MDPWIAAVLGASGASVVWAVALVAIERRRQRHQKRRPKGRPRRPKGSEATSAAADLVPLVFAPVTAFREIVDAAVPEIKSLFSPGGNVAIVFSDVVDSTALNHRLGDKGWADLLRTHDEAVRAVVRENGGKVVKRQGDGFMAAFHDPRSATTAALGFQDAVRNATRGSRVKLDLRVGVHAGEVVSERGDYFGTNVVMAARVAASARPGTVLVTDPVAEALESSVALEVHPLGKRMRLRGLPGRHQLHRAVRI